MTIAAMFDLDSTQLESTQKELQAMEEVGRLRSRSMGRAFFMSWIVTWTFLVLARTGLIWGGFIGGAIAGAIAKGWVSMKTDEFIAAACKKHGVSPEALDRGKYIIE